MSDDRSLNQILADLGYTTEPAGDYRKHIVRDGEICCTGTCHEVVAWLRSTGQWGTREASK